MDKELNFGMDLNWLRAAGLGSLSAATQRRQY